MPESISKRHPQTCRLPEEGSFATNGWRTPLPGTLHMTSPIP